MHLFIIVSLRSVISGSKFWQRYAFEFDFPNSSCAEIHLAHFVFMASEDDLSFGLDFGYRAGCESVIA